MVRRKLKIGQHELHLKPWVNSRYAIPAPLVKPIMLLLHDANIIYLEIVLGTCIRKYIQIR